KHVGQIPIVGVCPPMRVAIGPDELRIDSESIADSLDITFQQMGNAELLPNLARVARIAALIKICRGATDNLEIGNSRQVRRAFILAADGEKRGLFMLVSYS